LLQVRWIPHGGQGVQVGDEVKRLFVVLESDILPDRTKIIAEMKPTCRLNSGKHSHLKTLVIVNKLSWILMNRLQNQRTESGYCMEKRRFCRSFPAGWTGVLVRMRIQLPDRFLATV